jgi:hypothetical protein
MTPAESSHAFCRRQLLGCGLLMGAGCGGQVGVLIVWRSALSALSDFARRSKLRRKRRRTSRRSRRSYPTVASHRLAISAVPSVSPCPAFSSETLTSAPALRSVATSWRA